MNSYNILSYQYCHLKNLPRFGVDRQGRGTLLSLGRLSQHKLPRFSHRQVTPAHPLPRR